jgi:hypothetical protein
MHRSFVRVLLVVALLMTVTSASAQLRRRGGAMPMPAPAAGAVNLPHMVPDDQGNQWVLHNMGWLQQQGNMPIYNQGATLMVNQQHPQHENNQARIDEATAEIVFENMIVHGAQGITVTRRVLIDKEHRYVRYIDIFRNSERQDQIINVQIQSNLSFGVQVAQLVSDPKAKEQRHVAWVGQTHMGRAVVEVYSGRGAKVAPTIAWQQGHHYVQALMPLNVPGNKDVAIMHLHATAESQEQGVRFVNGLKESRLMASLAPEVRRLIINFPSAGTFAGEHELLRGEMFDIIELRSGDRVQGTLIDETFTLDTFYGTVEVPADRVLGLINIGQFRPRQLIATLDGEIFGGYLQKDSLSMKLASGQTINVPLTQMSRAGYRRRGDESEELPPQRSDQLIIGLRSGDRIAAAPPSQKLQVLTRYGMLELSPDVIAAVVFHDEQQPVHRVHLTDGSHFAALLTAERLEMSLSSGVAAKPVSFPTSSITRLQAQAEIPEPDDDAPILQLTNGDVFAGNLEGELQLDTAFDTLKLSAAEILLLSRQPEAVSDVQVTLWDQTTVSGQLREPQLQCKLSSGMTIAVPVALVETYTQPHPQPAAGMVAQIEVIVAQLDAEDWKQRDRAEAQLIAMGDVIIPVLKRLHSDQPAEAQQRIEHILATLGKRQN